MYSESSTKVPKPEAKVGHDIKEPGVYQCFHFTRGQRLIVSLAGDKFLYDPFLPERLHSAGAILGYKWTPVKEKITITFDNTEE